MNIFITVSTYYPLKDGVQNITQYYAEGLVKYGHNVTVITRKIGNMKSKEIYNGVLIRRVNIYTKASVYMGDIKGYRQLLIEEAKQNDIMINVCLQTAYTDCILSILKEFKCKKILYLHGMANFGIPKIPTIDIHDILLYLLNILRWKLFYLLNYRKISAYDMIIHLHEHDNTYKKFRKLKNVRNVVLENGCDFEWCEIDKNQDEEPYLCVSNYIHDKNQEFVLRAYYMSKTFRKLVFIGSKETSYFNKLKKLNQKLEKKYNRYGNVEFMIGISRDNTVDRIRHAFAFLSGSKGEKYPVMICESMRCAVPYISTDVGIVRYLPGGIVVKNEKEMAIAINLIEDNNKIRINLAYDGKKYSSTYQNMNNNLKKLHMYIEEISE